MRNYAICAACAVGLTLTIQPVLALAKNSNVKTTIVDCDLPGKTIGGALEGVTSDSVDEIVFYGTCVEDLDIRIGRVTVRGDGVAPTLQGRIDIVGAQQVNLVGFHIAASNKGIDARTGASVSLENMTVSGATDRNIHVRWNSNAILVNTRVSNAGGANLDVVDGASAGVFDGSTIEDAGQNNVSLSRANLVLADSVITGAGQFGLDVAMSSARVVRTVFQGNQAESVFLSRGGNADLVDSSFDTTVTVREGSHARIGPGSVLSVPSGRALEVRRGSSARFWQDVFVSTASSNEAIRVSSNSTLEQSQGQATIIGDVGIRENSFAKFRRAHVTGLLSLFQGAAMRIENDGTAGGQVYNGDIRMSFDSNLLIDTIDGVTTVNGNIECDVTSKFVVFDDPISPSNLAHTGTVNGC